MRDDVAIKLDAKTRLDPQPEGRMPGLTARKYGAALREARELLGRARNTEGNKSSGAIEAAESDANLGKLEKMKTHLLLRAARESEYPGERYLEARTRRWPQKKTGSRQA